jgi:hypothetical protein
VGLCQARSCPRTVTGYQTSWHCWQVGKVAVAAPVVSRLLRLPGQLVRLQSGMVRLHAFFRWKRQWPPEEGGQWIQISIPEKAMFVSWSMQVHNVIMLYCEWHSSPFLGLEYPFRFRDILHWVHGLQSRNVCRYLASTVAPVIVWVVSCLCLLRH